MEPAAAVAAVLAAEREEAAVAVRAAAVAAAVAVQQVHRMARLRLRALAEQRLRLQLLVRAVAVLPLQRRKLLQPPVRAELQREVAERQLQEMLLPQVVDAALRPRVLTDRMVLWITMRPIRS